MQSYITSLAFIFHNKLKAISFMNKFFLKVSTKLGRCIFLLCALENIIHTSRYYELKETLCLLNYRGNIFVDIGAHIVIEPIPRNFKNLMIK